jgi:natural product precursor
MIQFLKLKKMNNLKLNKLEEQNLAERQMYAIKGGGRTCTCSCSSNSIQSNMEANYGLGSNGGHSTSGGNCYEMLDNGTCQRKCDD